MLLIQIDIKSPFGLVKFKSEKIVNLCIGFHIIYDGAISLCEITMAPDKEIDLGVFSIHFASSGGLHHSFITRFV